jgi:hypothetical protein
LSWSSISSFKRKTEDAEGAYLELEEEGEGRGRRGGQQRAPSSPPSMADGEEYGGDDEPKTKILEIKI